MTTYHIFDNITAVGAAPPPSPGLIKLWAQGDQFTAQKQQFSALLSGVGNCSATVQIVGSNDGINFQPYLNFTVTGASADITPGQAQAGGNQAWPYIGGYISAISGTNASVNCLMNV